MKLYPAIVTAHLLGALGLLGLLAVQSQLSVDRRLSLPPALYRGAVVVLALCFVQIALGGWVSTNYAVLACREFPTCQGEWWPTMDFARGFTVVRGLGMSPGGEYLPFAALTAIHVVHRLGAAVVLVAVVGLAWRLRASGDVEQRWWAHVLVLILLWQLISGLSNVVLDWPLLAALSHTGGAAALVVALTMMITRARRAVVQIGTTLANPTTSRVK